MKKNSNRKTVLLEKTVFLVTLIMVPSVEFLVTIQFTYFTDNCMVLNKF